MENNGRGDRIFLNQILAFDKKGWSLKAKEDILSKRIHQAIENLPLR